MIIDSATIWEACRDLLMAWGLGYSAAQVIILLLAFLVVAVFAIILVLALVLLERRLIGWIQLRPGPNRVGGRTGWLQTVADALKLLYKEDIVPLNADRPTYFAAPYAVFMPVLLMLVVLPFGVAIINGSYRYFVVSDLNIAVLYVLAMGSVELIGVIMAGWGSGNKYALIGAMRAVAQLISYEVPLVLALVSVVLFAGSMSLVDIVHRQSSTWAIFPLFPAFVIFFITGVAETNRCPFDLLEAESEVVAGFHTEYSGMRFALFFLAEYLAVWVMAALIVVFFFGGWKGPMFLGEGGLWFTSFFWFMAKSFFFVWCFIWFRGTFPRIRVDQLMVFSWKVLLPLAVVQVMIVGWGITYRNPWFSANVIPRVTVVEAHSGMVGGFDYMTTPETLRHLTTPELVAFGWSVLGAIVVIVLLGAMLYRTILGFRPSREFQREIELKNMRLEDAKGSE